ncbi:MAG: DinB family protein [Candidatus Thorarchaeota archaeon]
MGEKELIRQLAKTTRQWRERALKDILESGQSDLSYRPSSGMSSIGWLIAHQAAVYDFSLNMLLQKKSPINPDLFKAHVPGTTGDWSGVSLDEMNVYYDECESALLDWVDNCESSEFERVIDGEDIPKFFRGMTVLEIFSNMFVHLNHHNGHLSSISGDVQARHDVQI